MSLQPIKGEKSLFILQAVIASPVEGRTDSLAGWRLDRQTSWMVDGQTDRWIHVSMMDGRTVEGIKTDRQTDRQTDR